MLQKLKISDRLTILISIVAILISVLSAYFQFFNKRHNVVYSNLAPDYNENNQTISIPILFKNLGNQTEVILNSNLTLERKYDSVSSFVFLPLHNKPNLPIILGPNETKLIELVGSYKKFLLGSYEISEKEELIYNPLTILDSLKLRVEIQYITTAGQVASQEIEIGFLSFDENKEFYKIDCNPIKLRKLDMRNMDNEILYFTKRKRNIKIFIDPEDSVFTEKLIFVKELIKDSILLNPE